ncbi:Gag-Pol polyprotein [Gossypium australe]|uniref:Gag-Pol polyprotein n=1 Tax=Gossypium australe TaxID=47621 RepID=A0A5B6WPA4_9ROSI|nr:Gag-Pol polyprotein [Gossypium australe]
MTVTEYEREFVRLSKYARECVSTEAIMCKRFEDGMNEDIRLLVGILELKEFIVLVERACKAEVFAKEKRKAEFESRDLKKRQKGKSLQSSSKKLREFNTRSSASVGFSNRNHRKQYLGYKAQTTSIASVDNARPSRPKCPHCGRRHPGECRVNDRTCFKCGSQDHFIRDCPEMAEKEKFQSARSGNAASRGRPQRNQGNGASNKSAPRDSVVRPEGRAPGRTYAIRACEEASSPNVITGTFSLYNTFFVALIDPGSTHFYVCMKLVSSMNMPVESTEFVIKVSNSLCKYVLVDKVCKNCPLIFRGHCFLANLMLLPFDECDIILGMDWLTMHDVVVNCGRKIVELKYESVCEYSNVFPDELPGLPLVREVEFGIELVPGWHLAW